MIIEGGPVAREDPPAAVAVRDSSCGVPIMIWTALASWNVHWAYPSIECANLGGIGISPEILKPRISMWK